MMKYDHEHKASHSHNFQMRWQAISRRGVTYNQVSNYMVKLNKIILTQVKGVEAVRRWI